MTARSSKPALMTVLVNNRAVGMILDRGRQGVEAFDQDERSLGVFPGTRQAHAAILAALGG